MDLRIKILYENHRGKVFIREDGKLFHEKPNGVIKERYSSIKKGYWHVTLKYPGIPKSKSYPIHRLVAQAFIQNPENKPTVNHIDGDKLNNHASNLEWNTVEENNYHARYISKANYTTPISKIRITDGCVIEQFETFKDCVSVNAPNVYESLKGNYILGDYIFVRDTELDCHTVQDCLLKRAKKPNKLLGTRLYTQQDIDNVLSLNINGISQRTLEKITGITRPTLRKMIKGVYFKK